ncbi:hydrolase 76 protein [Arachnomyces sp. PD_36]|nr:hydrolase 76 protein [Arachnomyces sp. PD_36]
MVAASTCRRPWATLAAALCLGSQVVGAIDLDLSSQDSIKSAAGSVAKGMMTFYHGNEEGNVPGTLPDPYYWWEAGGMLGALIDYWHFTGDSSYNDIVQQGILHQAGPENSFMPPNQTRTEGNADQVVWAQAALSAAEYSFPDPPAEDPQWLDLAKNAFDTMAARWDTETCDGGLRWQIFQYNPGYDYKDAASNGGFFNLAARLARFTGNDTYADWAVKAWDWSSEIGLIGSDFSIYDGTSTDTGCSEINKLQWSYNYGAYMSGAASMYNSTGGDTQWKRRIDGFLLNASGSFFKNDIMTEVACEDAKTCNVDQNSFKSYFARDLAATVQMAPYMQDPVMEKLSASAKAAAKVCVVSGDNDTDESIAVCPLDWRNPSDSDSPKNDVGTQMSALQVIQANLVQQGSAPVNSETASNTDAQGDSTSPSDAGTPTTSGSGGATSTGAAPELSAQQMMLASPIISLLFGYFL